jgi:hypothetical protein
MRGVCAVSDAFVRDWIWILAFFPLWLVTSGTMFGLAYGPKQAMGVRGQKAMNAFIMLLSLSTAAAGLMWLECTSQIHLPFARPACGMFPAAILSPSWL